MNTIFYKKNKNRIVRIMEKKVDTREKKRVIVTDKTIVHKIDKDPRLMERAGVTSALANEDNVDKIMTDLEQCQKNISQMKETLKRERGEGQSLKRKHEDMLSKIEKSKEACQTLQSDKDALVLSVNIIKGEKKDLEKQVMEAVHKGYTASKRLEELEAQNLLLREQLQVAKEKQMDITPF